MQPIHNNHQYHINIILIFSSWGKFIELSWVWAWRACLAMDLAESTQNFKKNFSKSTSIFLLFITIQIKKITTKQKILFFYIKYSYFFFFILIKFTAISIYFLKSNLLPNTTGIGGEHAWATCPHTSRESFIVIMKLICPSILNNIDSQVNDINEHWPIEAPMVFMVRKTAWEKYKKHFPN